MIYYKLDETSGTVAIDSAPNAQNGAVQMSWHGPIAAPMANRIRDAFEERKGQSSRLVLGVQFRRAGEAK